MSDLRFEVKINAVAEVRDADGNLISSEPVESVLNLSADEVRALTQGETL
jgi:hypothetical protein